MCLVGLLAMGLFISCEKDEKSNKDPEEPLSSIQGKVTDKETGEPLPGVTIELQLADVQVQTSEDGLYIFEELQAGTYTLKAQKEGYVDYTKDAIQLIAGQSLTLDIEMKKSDYTETAFGMNLDMVYVEGGKFGMGATAEQGNDASDDEKPVRTIKLDSYYIGKYEVT